MTEHVDITKTGERVREREGLVEVGLSKEAQHSLGTLLYFHPPKIGVFVEKGHHLFVVEGTLTAAEFYAPINGLVVSFAAPDALISDYLVFLKAAESPD